MLGDLFKTLTEKAGEMKNQATSLAAKTALQAKVGKCAEIQDLRIDSTRKTLSVTALLHGEAGAIEAVVGYSKTGSGIKVECFQSNRKWLNLAAVDHAIGKEFDLPAAVLPLL